jgi:glycosyltransferase involved in cell wall biosynthesis
MNAPPEYSVIVTAYNAAESIGRCLRSIADQEFCREAGVEIILVDDRGSDGTGAAALALGLGNLRIVRLDRHDDPALTARQAALEQGLAVARGGVIIVTDSDAVAPPGWLAGITAKIRDGSADAAAAPVEFADEAMATIQTVDAFFYVGFCRVLNGLGLSSGFFFGNCAFRKECYDAVGGFRRIGFALTEDLAFAQALRAHRFRIALQWRPVIAVRACRNWPELLCRAERTSCGAASALSLALAIWMGALVLLAVGTAVMPAVFAAPFLLRYFIGALFVARCAIGAGRARLTPWCFIYEPVAIWAALMLYLRTRGGGEVEWGGLRYPRRGPAARKGHTR